MTTNKFLTVGVAGHVDHGKTSLVRFLTGIDTDRLKEEKRRGFSIEPCIAPLQLPSGNRIALVDVPGHNDFLKNTIRGLSNVDMAILVVAADDGVMPQTKDHLDVLKFVQAKGGFIVLSKADAVDDETLELAEMEVREILEDSFLEGKQAIPFSAEDGRGLDQIYQAIENEVNQVDGKLAQAPFRLWVDQVRSIPGYGTVVSGTVLSGTIRGDDIVELLPSARECKVSLIEVHHERVEQAVAGQRVGLNLIGASPSEARLGTALASPGTLSPVSLLNVELSLLPTVRRPILNRWRVRLYIGTCRTTALLVMMEKERLHPGETGLAQLRLQKSLAIFPRDPFVISFMNRHCIIGGGRILEASEEKFRTAKAEKTLAYLQPLQKEDVKRFLSPYFLKFPNRPVTKEEIVSTTGFPVQSIEAVIKSRLRTGRLLHFQGRGYFERSRYELLKAQLIQSSKKLLSRDTFKLALSEEEIRLRLEPDLDNVLFRRMLGDLCDEEKLVRCEGGYRIPNLVISHTRQRERLVEKVIAFARSQGCATFSVGTFKKQYGKNFTYRDIERVINYLCEQKKLIQLNDGRFLYSEIMQEIKDKVSEQLQEKGSIAIKDCKEILGYGRTRAVPILDYLDEIGLTCRVGDVRVLVSNNNMRSKQGRR